MKKREANEKHGIKRFWIISYLIVFVVPLLLGVVAYATVFSNLKDQIYERNNIVLDSVCADFDNRLENIVNLTTNISMNKSVNHIATKFSSPLSKEDLVILYEFTEEINDIDNYESVNRYYDKFFIYFSNIDYVVTNSYAQPSQQYYGAHINNAEYSFDEWKAFITKRYDNNFIHARLYSDKNEYFYVKTIEVKSPENTYINIVYNISTDEIMKNVKRLSFYEHGTFSVTDATSNVIISENPQNKSEKKNSLLDKELSFSRTSKITGWEYRYILPSSKAYGNIYRILFILTLLGVLCVVLGIWLIKYFTHRNYKPINELMNLFPENERELKNNEFSYLNEKITESLSDNYVLNQEVNKQSKMIREHLINEILIGHTLIGKRSKEELEKLQFDIENDKFAVLIYSFFVDDAEKNSTRQLVIENVTNERLFDSDIKYASVKKNEDVIYIVRISNNSDMVKIKKTAEYLVAFAKKEFDFDFYCALSSCNKGDGGIRKGYNEAKNTIEYSILSEKTGFTKYDDISDYLTEQYFYSIEIEEQLVNLVKASEYDKAKELLEEILVTNLDSNSLSLISVRYLMTEMFSTIKKLMLKYKIDTERYFSEEMTFFENLIECRDISIMKSMIRSAFSKCCSEISKKADKRDDLVSNVMHYIDQNYTNQNLSIKLIAYEFSMNFDYIARRFREKTGKTINDYIRKVRIAKAKELLHNSDELITDIAEMVGFASYRTFIRTFTETVGVSPNKYKTEK